MTIDDAIAKLEAEFGPRADVATWNDKREICSGGERADPTDPAPALYISEPLAIAAWQRDVADHLRAQKPSCWQIIGGVAVDRFRITVADHMQTQRIAGDRFSVCAQIGIAWLTPGKGN